MDRKDETRKGPAVLKIVSLHCYPVKSLHGLTLDGVDLEPWGIRGDRRWVIVDDNGVFLSQRRDPMMATIHVVPCETGVVLHHEGRDFSVSFPREGADTTVEVWKDRIDACDAGPAIAAWLTDILGKPCRLVYMNDPTCARPGLYGGNVFQVSFADGFPLLVCTVASLRDLNARLTQPVPMARFRPNIVLDGAEGEDTDPWEEDCWTGLRIGRAALRIVKPCSRCIMTTVDQESGHIPQKGEPLQTLAKFRRQQGGVMFGQNALVENTARIHVGDAVEVLR